MSAQLGDMRISSAAPPALPREIPASQKPKQATTRARSEPEAPPVDASRAYAEPRTQPDATRPKTLSKNSALFGVGLGRALTDKDIAKEKATAARPALDALLEKVSGSSGQERTANLRQLQELLGKLGPDVVDQLPNGVDYVNNRLRSASADVWFEPIMDARTRWHLQLAGPGELRGKTGSVSFDFAPYSESTLQFLRSKGVQDKGMWAVQFEGMEAFDFRTREDGSTSARIGLCQKGVNSGNLQEALSGFLSAMGKEKIPPGYTVEVDLDRVPKDRRSDVRAVLSGLESQGMTVKYLETDSGRMIEKAMNRLEVDRRIDELLKKPTSSWNQEDRSEYEKLFALYHGRSEDRFES